MKRMEVDFDFLFSLHPFFFFCCLASSRLASLYRLNVNVLSGYKCKRIGMLFRRNVMSYTYVKYENTQKVGKRMVILLRKWFQRKIHRGKKKI